MAQILASNQSGGKGLWEKRRSMQTPEVPGTVPGRNAGFGLILLFLYQLLGFKETLEMSHLPNSNDYKNESLDYGPPENPLVCAFTGLPETLLPPLRKKGKYYWNNIKIQWDIFLWTVWGKQQNIENCAYLHQYPHDNKVCGLTNFLMILPPKS